MRTFRIVESAFSYSSCDRKNAKQDCIWHRDPHHGGIAVLQVKVTINIKDQRGWLVPVHSQERINPQQVRLGQNEVNSRLAFLVSLGGGEYMAGRTPASSSSRLLQIHNRQQSSFMYSEILA